MQSPAEGGSRASKDLARNGYAMTRGDGLIVMDWNAQNYILRLALNKAREYLEEHGKELCSTPSNHLESTMGSLLSMAGQI